VPISYEIDENTHLITLTISGRITGEDIAAYVDASRKDPRYVPGMNRLLVARQVTEFPRLQAVREITARTTAATPLPPFRIAAVADTPMGSGMIAMFLGHWGMGDRYEMFGDVSSALAWLHADNGDTI
jgi:hypothetical protein